MQSERANTWLFRTFNNQTASGGAKTMSKKACPRIVVGSLIDNESSTKKYEVIRLVSTAFMGGAWGKVIPGLMPSLTIMVEGENREGIKKENLMLVYASVDQIRLMIHGIETCKKKGGRSNPESPQILFSIGSKEFCAAVAHFWATGKNGDAANWGLHLIRQISSSQQDSVVWCDDDEFFTADIQEMVEHMLTPSS
jgi:hypothetical protein